MRARSFLLVLLAVASPASAAVPARLPSVPELVAAVDAAATGAVHDALAPFEPASSPAPASDESAAAPSDAPRPEPARPWDAASVALAVGVVAGLVGALLRRGTGPLADLARALLLVALAACAGALAWEAWRDPAAAPWTTSLLAALALAGGALALRRAPAKRPAPAGDPAYA